MDVALKSKKQTNKQTKKKKKKKKNTADKDKYNDKKLQMHYPLDLIKKRLENGDESLLGQAKTIKIDKDNTTIVGGEGDKKAISDRISEIKAQIEKSTSSYDKEQLQKRLAKLAGGVAVINVGATTETEMKEKKFRVEDTIAATRAALEEGSVAGGGIALIEAAKDPGGRTAAEAVATFRHGGAAR